MTDTARDAVLAKVPEVTFGFWIIKIAATTLGETGGDALSMTMHLGYALSSAVFFGIFLVLVTGQIAAKSFNAWLYWAVIVATTTAGTTMADYADRSLGIGYLGGSLSLFAIVMLVLATWRASTGTVAVNRIHTPRMEGFYWLTILFSNTLGTALGDWAADGGGLGFEWGAVVFAVGLAALAAIYFTTSVSRVALFWAAFILTRPLGATLGDLLTKPQSLGGLHLSRIESSLVIAAFIVACIIVLPQRAGEHPGVREARASA